jgi:hypothetical protein
VGALRLIIGAVALLIVLAALGTSPRRVVRLWRNPPIVAAAMGAAIFQLCFFTALALIAGGPTILGTLIGGFSYSPAITLLFLAIGIGAIFQVVFEVGMYLFKITDHHLFTLKNSIGFLLGLVIMYGTGLLVI